MPSIGLPKARRGLNAGSYPPLPLLVCPRPRLLKPSTAHAPVFSSRPPRQPRRPPSVQSPFAQLGCYLRWRDVVRLLGERYPSVVALTGSFAAPVGLSPPSAFSLVWRVLAGCNQSLLPTAASRRYLRKSFLGCWIPYPGGTPCALTCFFRGIIGLPQEIVGRLPASVLRLTTSRRVVFEDADISLCSGLQVCSPPRSLLPLRKLPQGGRGFYFRAHRALLPPHVPDMLTV
jgi:hypothetical protein